MTVKHKCSSSLDGWSTVLTVIGIISIIAAIPAFIFNESGKIGADLLNFGFLAIVVGVLFKGLAPVAAAAERKLAEAGYEEFIGEE